MDEENDAPRVGIPGRVVSLLLIVYRSPPCSPSRIAMQMSIDGFG